MLHVNITLVSGEKISGRIDPQKPCPFDNTGMFIWWEQKNASKGTWLQKKHIREVQVIADTTYAQPHMLCTIEVFIPADDYVWLEDDCTLHSDGTANVAMYLKEAVEKWLVHAKNLHPAIEVEYEDRSNGLILQLLSSPICLDCRSRGCKGECTEPTF